jgi:hypothetical protein
LFIRIGNIFEIDLLISREKLDDLFKCHLWLSADFTTVKREGSKGSRGRKQKLRRQHIILRISKDIWIKTLRGSKHFGHLFTDSWTSSCKRPIGLRIEGHTIIVASAAECGPTQFASTRKKWDTSIRFSRFLQVYVYAGRRSSMRRCAISPFFVVINFRFILISMMITSRRSKIGKVSWQTDWQRKYENHTKTEILCN